MTAPDPAPSRYSLWTIFRAPAAVGVLSIVGLVAALLADGAWDALGSACLGVGLAVVVWCLSHRRR